MRNPNDINTPLTEVFELNARASLADRSAQALIYPEQTSHGLVAVMLDVYRQSAHGYAVVVKDEALTATRFGIDFSAPVGTHPPIYDTASVTFDELVAGSEKEYGQDPELDVRYGLTVGALKSIVANNGRLDGIHNRKENPGYKEAYDLGSLIRAGVTVPAAVVEAWFKVAE